MPVWLPKSDFPGPREKSRLAFLEVKCFPERETLNCPFDLATGWMPQSLLAKVRAGALVLRAELRVATGLAKNA